MIISLFFASLVAHATPHLEYVCSQAHVQQSQGVYLNNPPIIQGNYLARRTRSRERGQGYVIETLEGQRIFQTTERIFDLVPFENDIIVLFAQKISVVNLKGDVIVEIPLNPLPYGDSHGRSMVLAERHLYIARGAAGVSAFSIDDMKWVWDADLRDSEKGGAAEAIVYDGEFLRIVAATTQEHGFTGVMKMSRDGKILSLMPYDNRRAGVIGIGARARWQNDFLFINNLGWIHQFNRSQLDQTRQARPRWIAHQIREADSRYHYMMLSGDMIIDATSVKGCGLTFEGINRDRVSKLFSVSL